ncbi:hypothetical protein [Kitasatospora sp. NPDC059571]|uniref:hypothetical protein n=1 Tax=Kitasatospora sp. NPDC059571 TaxID=3346871 RepID=UPI0036BE5DA5
MTQTAPRSAAPATAAGLVPGQRTPADPTPLRAVPPAGGLFATARRAFEVARGLRSLRPVTARPQEPYGEVDGQ